MSNRFLPGVFTYKFDSSGWVTIVWPNGNTGEMFKYPTLEAGIARAVGLCHEYNKEV